ncbi:hypothetical protein BB561_001439 [Smittium simulii]|uniref:Uncharacterized protein n=1 Tax=Smittium simulii TaxID=133385 RepID=A0A2T9YUR6_9FUNG|nr:hypothetical protein BB561_001439 [Smittium simulii]
MKKNNRHNNKKLIAKRVSAHKGVEYIYSSSDYRNPTTWCRKDRIYNQDDIETFEKNLLLERQKNLCVDSIDSTNAGVICSIAEARNLFIDKGVFENEKFLSELNSFKKNAANTLIKSKFINDWVPIKLIEKTVDSSGFVYYNFLCKNGCDKWFQLHQLDRYTNLIEDFEHNIEKKAYNYDKANSNRIRSNPSESSSKPNITESSNPSIVSENHPLKKNIASQNNNIIQLNTVEKIKDISKKQSILDSNTIPQSSEPNWDNFEIKLPNSLDVLEIEINPNSKKIKKKIAQDSIKQIELQAKPLKTSRPSKYIPEPVTLRGNSSESVLLKGTVMSNLIKVHKKDKNKLVDDSIQLKSPAKSNLYSSKITQNMPTDKIVSPKKPDSKNYAPSGPKYNIRINEHLKCSEFRAKVLDPKPISSLKPSQSSTDKLVTNPVKSSAFSMKSSLAETVTKTSPPNKNRFEINLDKSSKIQRNNEPSNSLPQKPDQLKSLAEELNIKTIFKDKIGFREKVSMLLNKKESDLDIVSKVTEAPKHDKVDESSKNVHTIETDHEYIIDDTPILELQGQVKFNSSSDFSNVVIQPTKLKSDLISTSLPKDEANFDTKALNSQADNVINSHNKKKDSDLQKKSAFNSIIFLGTDKESLSLNLSYYSNVFSITPLAVDLSKSSSSSSDEAFSNANIYKHSFKTNKIVFDSEDDERSTYSRLRQRNSKNNIHKEDFNSNKHLLNRTLLHKDGQNSISEKYSTRFNLANKQGNDNTNTSRNSLDTYRKNKYNNLEKSIGGSGYGDVSENNAKTKIFTRSRRGRSFSGIHKSSRTSDKPIDYTRFLIPGNNSASNSDNSLSIINSDSEKAINKASKTLENSLGYDSDSRMSCTSESTDTLSKKSLCEFCSKLGTKLTKKPDCTNDKMNTCIDCQLVSHNDCLKSFLKSYKIVEIEGQPPVLDKEIELNVNDMKNNTSWICIFCKTFKSKVKKVLAYRTIGQNNTSDITSSSIINNVKNVCPKETPSGSSLISISTNSSLSSDIITDLVSNEDPIQNTINLNSETLDKTMSAPVNNNTIQPDVQIDWHDKELLVILHGNSYNKLSWIPVFYYKLLNATRYKAVTKNTYPDSLELRKIIIPITFTQVDFFLDFESSDGNEIFIKTQNLRTIVDKSACGSMSHQDYERLYISIKKFYVKWKGLPISDSTYDEPPHPYKNAQEYKIWLKKWNNFQQMRKVSAYTAKNHIDSFERSYFSESRKLRISENKAYAIRKNQLNQAHGLNNKNNLELITNREKLKSKNLEKLKKIDELEKIELNKWVKDNFYEIKEQPEYLNYGKLYPYQLEGINWLLYKWITKESCILADEMGLGKTIQIASFFSILLRLMSPKANSSKMKSIFAQNRLIFPFLVVVPNSLIDQWIRELGNWAPDIVALAYNGSKESKEMISNYLLFRKGSYDSPHNRDLQCHVVVTSYETMTRSEGITTLKKFSGEWQCLVVDEGHRLKNDASKLFHNLNQLKWKHCVLLTGTPVQNHVREIINLMHFVQPKIFSDVVALDKEFENANEEKLGELRKMIQPHFLRRWRDVALNDLLPAKHEIIVPVSLTAWQRELYRAILKKNVRALDLIQKMFEKKTSNLPKHGRSLSLNNVLMQVRKIIDHPYIYDYNTPDFQTIKEAQDHLVKASGKMHLLDLLTRDLLRRGKRILIFAQFKEMLNNLEDYFFRQKIEYLRIDGDTPQPDRLYYVDLFNNNPDKYPIFLATTRAGGVGLNIHTADTVILYSPDWNPQIDMQALSRAYRIGQKKPVLVLRLMTQNSAEERIMQVAAKKVLMDHILIEKMNSTDDNDTVADKDLASTITCGAKDLFDEQNESEVNIFYDETKVVALLDECEKTLLDKDATKRNIDKSIQNKVNTTDITEKIDSNIPLSPDGNMDLNSKKSLFSYARIWDVAKSTENNIDISTNTSDTNLDWINKLKIELENQNKKDEQLGRGFRRKNQVVYFAGRTEENLKSSKSITDLPVINSKEAKTFDKIDHSSDSDFALDLNVIVDNSDDEFESGTSNRSKNIEGAPFKIFTTRQIAQKPADNSPSLLKKSPYLNNNFQTNIPNTNVQNLDSEATVMSTFMNLFQSNPKIKTLINTNMPEMGKYLIIQAVEFGKPNNLHVLLKSASAKSYLEDFHSVANLVIHISSQLDETFLETSKRLAFYLHICCLEAVRLGCRTSDSRFLENALNFVSKHSQSHNGQNMHAPLSTTIPPSPSIASTASAQTSQRIILTNDNSIGQFPTTATNSKFLNTYVGSSTKKDIITNNQHISNVPQNNNSVLPHLLAKKNKDFCGNFVNHTAETLKVSKKNIDIQQNLKNNSRLEKRNEITQKSSQNLHTQSDTFDTNQPLINSIQKPDVGSCPEDNSQSKSTLVENQRHSPNANDDSSLPMKRKVDGLDSALESEQTTKKISILSGQLNDLSASKNIITNASKDINIANDLFPTIAKSPDTLNKLVIISSGENSTNNSPNAKNLRKNQNSNSLDSTRLNQNDTLVVNNQTPLNESENLETTSSTSCINESVVNKPSHQDSSVTESCTDSHNDYSENTSLSKNETIVPAAELKTQDQLNLQDPELLNISNSTKTNTDQNHLSPGVDGNDQPISSTDTNQVNQETNLVIDNPSVDSAAGSLYVSSNSKNLSDSNNSSVGEKRIFSPIDFEYKKLIKAIKISCPIFLSSNTPEIVEKIKQFIKGVLVLLDTIKNNNKQQSTEQCANGIIKIISILCADLINSDIVKLKAPFDIFKQLSDPSILQNIYTQNSNNLKKYCLVHPNIDHNNTFCPSILVPQMYFFTRFLWRIPNIESFSSYKTFKIWYLYQLALYKSNQNNFNANTNTEPSTVNQITNPATLINKLQTLIQTNIYSNSAQQLNIDNTSLNYSKSNYIQNVSNNFSDPLVSNNTFNSNTENNNNTAANFNTLSSWKANQSNSNLNPQNLTQIERQANIHSTNPINQNQNYSKAYFNPNTTIPPSNQSNNPYNESIHLQNPSKLNNFRFSENLNANDYINQSVLSQNNNNISMQNALNKQNYISQNHSSVKRYINTEAINHNMGQYNKFGNGRYTQNLPHLTENPNIVSQMRSNIQKHIEQEVQTLMKDQIQQQLSVIQEQLNSKFEAKISMELENKVQEQLRLQFKKNGESQSLSSSAHNNTNTDGQNLSTNESAFTQGENANLNSFYERSSDAQSSNYRTEITPVYNDLSALAISTSTINAPLNVQEGHNSFVSGNTLYNKDMIKSSEISSANSFELSKESFLKNGPNISNKDPAHNNKEIQVNVKAITLSSLINDCPLCGLDTFPHVANDCPFKNNVSELVLRRDAIKIRNDLPENLKEMVKPCLVQVYSELSLPSAKRTRLEYSTVGIKAQTTSNETINFELLSLNKINVFSECNITPTWNNIATALKTTPNNNVAGIDTIPSKL